MNHLDIRQVAAYGAYMKRIGWRVEKTQGFQIFIRHLPLLGNFIKIQRPPLNISPSKIEDLAKKYQAFAVQISYDPGETLHLDLTPPLDHILKQMKKDARYGIRKAKRNKIVVKQSADIESFIKIWHENALRRGFFIPFGREIKSIYEAFEQKAYLLLSFCSDDLNHQEKPLAGALILIHNKIASYFHAASTQEGRKLSAPYLVIFEAIKLAKKKGCQIFDFEGIYDERSPRKSWRGFTHFKKSFGGKEVEYPRSFVIFFNLILRLLARFFP